MPDQRRLGGVVGNGLLLRAKTPTPACRPDRERMGEIRRQRLEGRSHDRLVAVEMPERTWSSLLGQQQGRPTTGVPESEGLLEPETVDHGEDIARKTCPFPVPRICRTRATVGPEVEGEALERVETAGELGQHHGMEPRGMGEEQRWTLASEVVHGNVGAVGCLEAGNGCSVGHRRHLNEHLR